jgi:amino-acid N-acetyltransferase
MTDAVTTRRATTDDAPTIKRLIDLYVPSGTLLPRTEEFIALHVADFLVAERDGVVVGCVHLDEYAPSLAEVRSLAVDPAEQGSGIGVRLVEDLERLAVKRGYATLFAVSNSDTFFMRCGYAPRTIPELNVERSEVSKFKGVYAKDVARHL